MNEWFFGDKCDLVKWSVLLRLAEKYKISIVLQICFRTECNWPTISFDGEPATVDIHQNVKKHFRSLQSVEQMPHRPLIKVFLDLFGDNRESYVKGAFDFMASFRKQSRIVFLDPDIGLVPPSGHATRGHLTRAEVEPFWKDLERKEVLVLYQHGDHRRGERWLDEKKEQFAETIETDPQKVHVARSTGAPRDVAFYYARKGD